MLASCRPRPREAARWPEPCCPRPRRTLEPRTRAADVPDSEAHAALTRSSLRQRLRLRRALGLARLVNFLRTSTACLQALLVGVSRNAEEDPHVAREAGVLAVVHVVLKVIEAFLQALGAGLYLARLLRSDRADAQANQEEQGRKERFHVFALSTTWEPRTEVESAGTLPSWEWLASAPDRPAAGGPARGPDSHLV